MHLPRVPSPALYACILAEAVDAPSLIDGATLLHADGTDLSEPEQRRVRGWLAADDADPFEAAS